MLERFRTALPEHEGGHHPSREQDDSSKPFSIHETEDRLVFSGAGVIRQATLEFNRSPVAIEASPATMGLYAELIIPLVNAGECRTVSQIRFHIQQLIWNISHQIQYHLRLSSTDSVCYVTLRVPGSARLCSKQEIDPKLVFYSICSAIEKNRSRPFDNVDSNRVLVSFPRSWLHESVAEGASPAGQAARPRYSSSLSLQVSDDQLGKIRSTSSCSDAVSTLGKP
eukprot:GABV01008951.1.p1 GENE.GABV01008951.1~~GABV01008951.1.p1  ORF type:complete len:225 (-),score=35.40 GABV01008951.1:68-742(-)